MIRHARSTADTRTSDSELRQVVFLTMVPRNDSTWHNHKALAGRGCSWGIGSAPPPIS